MPAEKNKMGTTTVHIMRMNAGVFKEKEDMLAIEEPLEIRLAYGPREERNEQSLSVTMRTPGNDAELAVGFLFTEGIIQSASDLILPIQPSFNPNIVRIDIAPHVQLDWQRLKRNFYTTSSCGVCGKESIESVKTVCPVYQEGTPWQAKASIILSLPQRLREAQSLFETTGGIHASALYEHDGELLLLREDVGRHNALDKLIGASLLKQEQSLALTDKILLLSGRASFELIQKAAMAGIRMVCAVGAPSSLAVEMAQGFGMTLIGFLREGRFNVYNGAARVKDA